MNLFRFGSKNNNKIIAIIVFILIGIANIINIVQPPAGGYEISIFDAFPISFWIILFFSYIILIIWILMISYSSFSKMKDYVLPCSGLLLVTFVYYLLPYVRGYFLYGRNDPLVHRGFLLDIIATGKFDNLLYPGWHILCDSLYLSSGLDLNSSMHILPIFLPLLYFLFIFLLSRIFSDNVSHFGILISVLSICTVSSMFVPYLLTFLMIPFILFMFIKHLKINNSSSLVFILLVGLFALPFLHPLGAIFTYIYILCILFSLSIWIRYVFPQGYENQYHINKLTIIPAIIALIFWFLNTDAFSKGAGKVMDYSVEFESSKANTQFNVVTNYDLNVCDIINILFNNYGEHIIYYIGALFCVIIFIYFITHEIFSKYCYKMAFCMAFILLIGILFVIVLSPILTYMRVIKYCFLASAIFIGLMLPSIYKNMFKIKYSKQILYICIGMLVITSQFFAITNLYPSPLTKTPNHQVSLDDFERTEWLLNYRNENLLVDEVNSWQYRYATAILGEKALKKNLRYQGSGLTNPPDHFNYHLTNNNQGFERYLLTNKLSYDYFTSLNIESDKFNRFIESDRYVLDSNPIFNELYSNGDSHVHIVFWS